ncbi:MAG TPA: aminotransferase class V-fold PLP-dependent enzyme [Prolixibacteraceae bacterium]|nr:aminotransferase class V-fold PLP-dependent enzyme [Prolixibacteraceae bacterium]
MNLEKYFNPFKKKVVGDNQKITTPFGLKKIIYADWIASGRLYEPIEQKISNDFGPYVANTHSEASATGEIMTKAYKYAHGKIKMHVNAGDDDVIITAGFGMTSVLAKFQRILGLRITEKLQNRCLIREEDRPVVFITHMEHHSNQTPWIESIADVVIIPPDENLEVNPNNLRVEIEKFKNRKILIGSFTACSNVTGIKTPYYELAEIMHEYNGYCFVDFAASAPYVNINMHPENPKQSLDAIFFSPHKFLGGPGSSGVLIFHKSLYKNRIPDHPGGGTVNWTNPWGEHSYVADIEIREDGGTPGFLQAIKTTLAIQVKEQMGVEHIQAREKELVNHIFKQLETIPGINILAGHNKNRLAIVSFFVDGIHHNLMVRLLSDLFGIQARGGCSCAGTYGHYLLHVDKIISHKISTRIDNGDMSLKPGWVRLSLHPTTSDAEVDIIINAITQIVNNIDELSVDYEFCTHTNEYCHKSEKGKPNPLIKELFKLH